MKTNQGFAAVVGFALITTVFTHSAAAQAPSAQGMADLTGRLALASTHAARLVEALDKQVPITAPATDEAEPSAPAGHDIGAWEGPHAAKASMTVSSRPAVSRDVAAALDGLEATVREARALAGGHPYLEPGIGHVLTNVDRIRTGTAPIADADALGHEIAIELLSVANNARVLQAEAELREAAFARRWNRTDAFRDHLEAAARVMGDAQEQGAYHLEDDLATLKVVLARLKEGASPRQAVSDDAVEELIGDINEHLADLGGE
jgi:hypothetical protein